MTVRKFVYGTYLAGMIDKGHTLESVVRLLEECIITYGLWGNVDGISCVTGLPRSLVEHLIAQGGMFCDN